MNPLNALTMIPPDKLAHFIAGTIVSAIACLMTKQLFPHYVVLWTVLSPVIAGVLKESADWYMNKYHGTQHGVEWQDALATSLGFVPVMAGVL